MIQRKITQAQALVHQSVSKVIDAGRANFARNRKRTTKQAKIVSTQPRKNTPLLQSPFFLFAREILVNPRAMGAACPSSRHLSRALASMTPLQGDGVIVELGGGTGKVTEALLKHGIHPSRLIVLERSPVLAEYLRKRFPELQIIEGDAMHLCDLLGTDKPIDAIVSGLPLRSLPQHVVHGILKQVDICLQNRGLFVQFTYDLTGRTAHLPHHFKRVNAKIVWNNLPPARVDAYQLANLSPVKESVGVQ
ncbi:phospholipid N-methyltransferase [Beggiatoa alba B18LD]|uniref:Phospholipid N-methyltransferase n=1 Tax=Beggiatoa alba B18LD TaxID=395493 RepID=I3CFC9_9GAMM|nr:methyltransferase domain-containing protein [Beggiatoa alba]EIJ42322.1 phospholipid N-methyltransferase [Beggiatoa alba B18LD]